MSTALEVVRTSNLPATMHEGDRITNIQRLGNILAASGYFSDVKDVAQAAVKVMAGEELGIAPVAAVMGIHIIKGKVTLSANLIAAQVRRHGYDYKHVQFDNQGCVLTFFGKKGEVLGESSFTEADAKTAGVYSDMYKKFPRNMYFSRAMSNGAKWYCPEATCGLPVYTPEEMGAKVDGEGDIVQPDKQPDLPPSIKPNTQAAADHVAQQKIEELKKQQESGSAAAPQQQTTAAPQQSSKPVRAEVEALWKSMTDFKSTLAAFDGLKKDLIELLGADAGQRMYYGILGKQGVEHANQFKTTRPARIAAQEMLEAVLAAQQPPSVGDDSLPEGFGDQQ